MRYLIRPQYKYPSHSNDSDPNTKGLQVNYAIGHKMRIFDNTKTACRRAWLFPLLLPVYTSATSPNQLSPWRKSQTCRSHNSSSPRASLSQPSQHRFPSTTQVRHIQRTSQFRRANEDTTRNRDRRQNASHRKQQ
jgi:hypothetical protein